MMNEPIRLNKYFSEIGFCSRRAADKLIDQERVLINNKTAIVGQKVNRDDIIKVDGELLNTKKERQVYLAFNKPIGIVCTTDTRVEKDNIIDFINYPSRILSDWKIG